MNPKDGLTCLYDGMNGEYIAIGHVIEKTSNHEELSGPISLNKLPTPSPEAMVSLGSLLNRLGVDQQVNEIGWHVIQHVR